jgi:hypothetical protein
MTLHEVRDRAHVHLQSRSIDGAEFYNTIYENDVDASLAFTGIAVNLIKYADISVTIEEVYNSIQEDKGIYFRFRGLVIVLYRCNGGCFAATWN